MIYFIYLQHSCPAETAEWLPPEADLFMQDIWLPAWYCWYDHIDEKYWTTRSNEYKSQMSHLLTLMNTNRTPSICMYCHQKWQCGFLPLFFSKKLTYVHEMFPLLRVWQAHHSRSLSQRGQDSRDAAWDHSRVFEDRQLGKGKSKGRLYITQRFTFFAMPVHSDTNSASRGSILTMQQFRVTTKSFTFPPMYISCWRNSCHIDWIVNLWACVPFAFVLFPAITCSVIFSPPIAFNKFQDIRRPPSLGIRTFLYSNSDHFNC